MKRLAIPLSILLACLVLLGCGTKATSTTPAASTTPATTTVKTTPPAPTTTTVKTLTPKYGGTFTYVSDSPPAGSPGYPPQINTASTEAFQLFFEGLLREDRSGTAHPWLATSYKLADDFKSITFTLRQGVKFQDGSDFDATVAKWNLDNIITAKLAPFWDSVDVIDNYTVRVNLKAWNNTVLRQFTDGNLSWMASKAAFDKNGLDWLRQNPVGTGPFKLVSYSRDSGLKSIRNPDYWGKDAQGNKLPYLDGININYIPDMTTELAFIQSGGGDAIVIPLGKMTADVKALGLTINASPISVIGLVGDTANADSPFSNQQVREAIEYAIDRDQIAQAFGYGYWQASYQLPPRAFAVWDPGFPAIRKYDPAKAQSLLAAAGYPSIKSSLINNPNNGSDARDVAVSIQNFLAKVNVNVDLQFPEFSKYQPSYLMGSWNNALLLQVFPGFANYNYMLNLYFGTTTPPNYLKSWLRSPTYAQLLNTSMATPTPDIQKIRAVIQQLAKEASVIPIYESGKDWALRPYVMDGGFTERSLPQYYTPEKMWLNK